MSRDLGIGENTMGVPLRVLIVEDSENDVLLLVRELKRGGYDVTYQRVDNAPGLNTVLGSREWDLIVTDYSMPNFNGIAALKMVREKGLDIPFIFLSGTIGEDTAVTAMKLVAHDYIIKGNLARLLPAI